MKMKKFIAVVSMVGMLAAAMTGCGSGSDDAKDADKGGDAKYAGDWDSANDITVVSREDGSGTSAFIELFGIQEEVDGEKVDMTTTEAQITDNTSVMMTTVEGNEYAIGYISLGSLDEDAVKALKHSTEPKQRQKILKTEVTKYQRPFNVAVKKDLDNEAAKDFMVLS